MSQFTARGDAVYSAGRIVAGKPGASATERNLGIPDGVDTLHAETGGGTPTLLKATVRRAGTGGFAETNAVWDTSAAAGSTPTCTCVKATFASPELAIEFQMIPAL